jgi:predicted amino acid-binding ACT domain protein
MHSQRFYTLSASCPDQVGIIARVAGFIAEHNGWILESSYPLRRLADGRYFMRIEVKADSLPFHLAEFRERFRPIAEEMQMDWRISDSGGQEARRDLVSKQEHCLYDLLARWQSKELDIEIPCVISNHDTFKGFVEWHGIPFHHVPVTADNKEAAYAEMQRLFEEVRGDTMVLARYMQIIPPELCAAYPADHQHPPQLPAQLRRRQALPPGLHARRQADRRDLPLRDQRTRPGADHRAGRDPHRPLRLGRRHGALRQGHRKDRARARPALPPGRPGAGARQQDGGVPAAVERMRAGGIHTATTEMVIFEWLHRAGTDDFRALLPLLR